jgi:hypothetical protein
MKNNKYKRFKPTPMESTEARCKRFIRITREEEDNNGNAVRDIDKDDDDKENK